MEEATDEELAAHSQVMGELKDIAQKLWGVPDCEQCSVASTCDMVAIFGLDRIKAGNPSMQGCSNYRPLK